MFGNTAKIRKIERPVDVLNYRNRMARHGANSPSSLAWNTYPMRAPCQAIIC